MNHYHIRIDGEIMPNSYTYEELLLNGIFDFDDIEVKQVSKSNWTNIRTYYFPEEHKGISSESQSFYIDENGQVRFSKKDRKNQTQEDYTIDEFGQVVSQHNIGGGSIANSSSTGTSSSSSSNQSYNTSSDDNKGWKIFFTIVAIIVFIVITCTTGWGSIPAGLVGYWTLKSIWGDDF